MRASTRERQLAGIASPPEGAPFGRRRQTPAAPMTRSDMKVRTLADRAAHAARRFAEIAQSDGLAAAVMRAARRVGRKLGRFGLFRSRFAETRCDYFTPPPKDDPYDIWMRANRDNQRQSQRIEAALMTLRSRPRLSILVPVYNPPHEPFRTMIESVLAQSYPGWELILVDDASPDARVRPEIERWSRRDSRIKAIYRVENGSISVATNDAAAAAAGEFLVLLDHDDLLAPDALAHIVLYLDAHPDTDLLYSDDDKTGMDGRRHSPQFKPDWSPELLLSFCYTGHLTAVHRRLYHEVGGMRAGYEGSQDHDFWLRASERAQRIGHVPQVLYHWRPCPGRPP